MEAYTGFAQVYDMFMDNVPYEEWCAYICGCFRQNGISEGAVLDLGCGTGELTRLMAKKGYDMIAVDSSVDMLEIASQNWEDGILYIHQRMEELELGESVQAAYSACDSVNYILEEEDLLQAFCRVYSHLMPGGIFLFDMNTDYKYRVLLGENTFAESRDEGSFIWENYYDEESAVNEYDLTLFIPEEGELFRRYTELHYQKNYSMERVRKLLEQAGFCDICLYDDYTDNPVREDSERCTITARKK
ncbi:MAG: class I SAM-dependent methyltransferase [Lachnospiraceae bacterium]|nr:class I SAM-dependent methyltransferase [Lachnospiraceae bacterium]